MFSISEDGAFHFCLPDTKSSGKYKIRFNFKTVDHPIFGTSKYLQGEIPLFHCQRSLPISNFFDVCKTEQDRLILNSVKSMRPILEDLDEDDLNNVVSGFTVFTALWFPRFDVNSSIFEIGSEFIIGGYSIDDVTNEQGVPANLGFVYRVIWGEICSSKDKQYTLDVYERVLAKYAKDYHPSFHAFGRAIFDNLKTQFVKPEHIRMGLAHRLFCLMEGAELMDFTGEGPLTLSEETLASARGHDSGIELMLEFYVALQEIHVHEFIRNTVLFQMLVQKVREFGGLLNDIFGLPKDMQIEGYDNNAILRRIVREGISLEQSFQDALNRLLNMCADLNVLIQRMRQAFPAEKDVEAFILACMDVSDGQTLSYLFSSKFRGARYHSLKAELVETE